MRAAPPPRVKTLGYVLSPLRGGSAFSGPGGAYASSPGFQPRVFGTARAAALGFTLLALAACATGPRPAPVGAHGVPPWEIPAAELNTQRLYRASYSGPEGDGSFRMTLRLVSPERYEVEAADPVGRSLWSLDVAAGRGRFLNHRARTACTFEGSFDLAGVPLGPFPLLTLPALLLGRVPAAPAAAPKAHGHDLSFHDTADRVWSVTAGDDGVVTRWTLSDSGAPTVWWFRQDAWSILSDRARGVQIRWREVLSESLKKEPDALAVPTGYHEGACRDEAAPLSGVSDSPPGAI
ncbi:MAG TPA: hypothetical protein VH988_28210 [Thermoanaerobaculia bacterium]|nr:hypothetical protein [Thermoanaerobaculia bacterium]